MSPTGAQTFRQGSAKLEMAYKYMLDRMGCSALKKIEKLALMKSLVHRISMETANRNEVFQKMLLPSAPKCEG